MKLQEIYIAESVLEEGGRVIESIDKSPSPELSMCEDFLEVSEKIYHKKITDYQLAQYDKKMAWKVMLTKWAQEALDNGTEIPVIEEAIEKQCSILEKNLYWELQQHMLHLQYIRQIRDEAIAIFCEYHSQTTSGIFIALPTNYGKESPS